jgi:hypothetical protein
VPDVSALMGRAMLEGLAVIAREAGRLVLEVYERGFEVEYKAPAIL